MKAKDVIAYITDRPQLIQAIRCAVSFMVGFVVGALVL